MILKVFWGCKRSWLLFILHTIIHTQRCRERENYMLQGEEASILTDETNSVLLLRNTNKPNSWEIFTFATTTQHTRQEWKTYLRYTCFYILFLILSSLLLSCKWNLLSTKLKWYLFGSIEEKSVLSNILFFFSCCSSSIVLPITDFILIFNQPKKYM